MRSPDFVISANDPANPYMLRWYIIPRNRWFNIYLHKILRSDDDRALHDHPWFNVSIVLKGEYIEILPGDMARRVGPGNIIFRTAKTAHRLVVLPGEHVWSLFLTGPKIREWGFHCENGWRHWEQFVMQTDRGAIGKGCD